MTTPPRSAFPDEFVSAFERLAQSSGPATDRLSRGSRLARGSASSIGPLEIDSQGGISTTVKGSGAERYPVTVRFSKLSETEETEMRSRMAAGNGPDAPDADASYYFSLALPESWAFFEFACSCVDAKGTGGELSSARKPRGAPCKHGAAVLYKFAAGLSGHPNPVTRVLKLRSHARGEDELDSTSGTP